MGGLGLFFNLGRLAYLSLAPRSPLTLVVYLLGANLVLGVFNLIPAFPMDGGRVLRALLAMWTDHPRATRIAARLGQAIAVGLVLLALSPFGDISLILIAVFVFTGASFEDKAAQARAVLELRVRHAMPMRTVWTGAGGYAGLRHGIELSQPAAPLSGRARERPGGHYIAGKLPGRHPIWWRISARGAGHAA
jgi:hypothetical protein